MKFFQSKNEKFLEIFARIGLSAKGVVYCLLSFLSFMAALGLRGARENKKETFKFILDQPFGQVLLVVLALSLLGFVTFRLFQSIADSDKKGRDIKAIFKRLGYGISALLYLSLSFFAFKMAFVNSESGDSSKQHLIQKVMEYPGGRLLISAVGAIIIGQGIFQIYRGITKKFMKKVELYQSSFKKTFERIGILGNVSRGIVLCILGTFLIQAAITSNAREAEDTGGAFQFLQKTGGNWLLGIMSVGLFAYGLFMFVRAKHEKIRFKI